MISVTNSLKLIVAGLACMATASCFPAQASAQGIEKYLRKADANKDGRVEPVEMTSFIKMYLKGKGIDPEKRYEISDLVAQVSKKTAQASTQGIERYLRNVDANKDGRVEPVEMTPFIKRYLKGKGIDPEKRYKISDLVARVSEKKQSPVVAASDLKVPKFGVEPSKKVGVQGFGVAVEKVEYSASVTSKAKDLFRVYDRNRNGVLDNSEISRMSWGSPRPAVNDKNGDGRLTFQEVQGRYHDREVATKQSGQSERNASSSRGDQPQSGGRGQRRYRGGRAQQGLRSDEDSSPATRRVSTSAASNERASTKNTKEAERSKLNRAEQYVDQYFESRDLDKNGVLEGDELKKVNSKSKYDQNRDGKITKAEMREVVAPSGQNSKSSSSRSSSKAISKTPSSFGKADMNEDGLIQMHEFSKIWTKKKLDEFLSKDANSDGVISSDEW